MASSQKVAATEAGPVPEEQASEAARRAAARALGRPLGALAGVLGLGMTIATLGSGSWVAASAWCLLGAWGAAAWSIGRESASRA